MPRLTNKDFLARHHFLKRVWEDANLHGLFSFLSSNEQWDLHQYYQTINTGKDADIVETRTTVNAGDDSLPQRAGRAYMTIFGYFQKLATPRVVLDPEDALPLIEEVGLAYLDLRTSRSKANTVQKRTKGRHYVRAIANPEPDMKALAKALLMLAEHQLNEEREKEGKPPIRSIRSRRY